MTYLYTHYSTVMGILPKWMKRFLKVEVYVIKNMSRVPVPQVPQVHRYPIAYHTLDTIESVLYAVLCVFIHSTVEGTAVPLNDVQYLCVLCVYSTCTRQLQVTGVQCHIHV